MHAYGDESGHLRNLLHGDESEFAVGVIAGPPVDCARCPNRRNRKLGDHDEIKWSNLPDVEKRRFMECLADQSNVDVGTVTITRTELDELPGNYHLYQNSAFSCDWDMGILGIAYDELLTRLGVRQDWHFVFDRPYHQRNAEAVKRILHDCGIEAKIRADSSRSTPGIQAADCVAGGARETPHVNNWLDELPEDRLIDESDAVLTRVASQLAK